MWFRKFTVAKAQALHLVGWCANTQRGTVMGECQGKPQALEEMKVRPAAGRQQLGASSSDASPLPKLVSRPQISRLVSKLPPL